MSRLALTVKETVTTLRVPVLRIYDHSGNLLNEVCRETTLSLEAKEAIVKYIYKKIIHDRERENSDCF